MTAKKRGRPSTGKAATGAARVKRLRDRVKADGGQRFDLVLDRESVNALLVCIGAHSGLTYSQLVGQLLQREARFLQGVESELEGKPRP